MAKTGEVPPPRTVHSTERHCRRSVKTLVELLGYLGVAMLMKVLVQDLKLSVE